MTDFSWLNEPPRWDDTDGELHVVTGDKTDFWRATHYGFIRDDGHFRFQRAAGDFTATVEFRGDYRELYDQAGLMLRIDARNWIKAGIEFVDGRQMLSVVVTRDFSDWSTMPLPVPADWLELRLARKGDAVTISWSAGGSESSMLRLAYFPPEESVLVGPMCCSPKRAGFAARFRAFKISRATAGA